MDKTILVVDDSLTARNLIKSKLIESGYAVIEAASCYEALEAIENKNVDLATIDLEMPDMNGFQLCAEIRRREIEKKTPTRLPTIILTANDSIEERQKGFESGASNFVTKSKYEVELLLRIKAVLEPDKKYSELGVLVIEDSPVVRGIIVSILNEFKLNVFEASDGLEGLEIFKKNSSKIDMVLTDLELPKLSGEELCLKIRNELSFKTMPIVVIAIEDNIGVILSVYRSGASEYIRKPFIKEELIARLIVHFEKLMFEKQLGATIAELKVSSQMKDNFLSICSHDLRSPLCGILGWADIMLMDKDTSKQGKVYLDGIKKSGDDLLALVDDLLDLARANQDSESQQLEPLCLSHVLEICLHQQRSIASKKQIDLNILVKDAGVKILGNPGWLKRIANNLLSNAIKFTRRGGKIEVDVLVESGLVNFKVTDSGIGIDPQKLSSIFEKYTKVGRLGTEGEQTTGLGLSIVKELVDRQSGVIHVESQVGKGTCFSVSFVIVQD